MTLKYSQGWRSTGFAAAVGAALLLPLWTSFASAGNKFDKVREIVPSRMQVESRSKPLKQERTALSAFETAPFPYRGKLPGSNTPFLNIDEGGRRGHSTPSGHVYWEDETYNDRRVLLYIPKGFDIRRPSMMIVYFHGHGATLERDVIARQKVAQQISESGANVVLVAPQLAVDAADSSAGNFWEPGAFGRFIGEAGQQLTLLHGDRRSAKTFASMPVVVVAYSGGYLPAAWCVERGGLKRRVRGVFLLDALYGEIDKFASWIKMDRSAFFVSAYLNSTREKNTELRRILSDQDVAYNTALRQRLGQGDVSILSGGTDVKHRDLVTHAWVDYPIRDLLKRLPEYAR